MHRYQAQRRSRLGKGEWHSNCHRAWLTMHSRPPPVRIEGALSLEALELHDALEAGSSEQLKHISLESNESHSRHLSRPLSQWECLSPRRTPTNMHVVSKKPVGEIAVAHSSTLEHSRFQRFIRRMESAGPKIILDRLKEEWDEPLGDDLDGEVIPNPLPHPEMTLIPCQLALEKQLWLLTGFQMQNLGKDWIAPRADCDTGRILELYGNLGKSTPWSSVRRLLSNHQYQLSSTNCQLCIQTKQCIFSRPGHSDRSNFQVTYLTSQSASLVQCPYLTLRNISLT